MKIFNIEFTKDLLEIIKRLEYEKNIDVKNCLLRDKKFILRYLGLNIVEEPHNNKNINNSIINIDELINYIYTLPDAPDAIPYITSYYKERFGFCMSENQKKSLAPGKYHMVVDSEFIDGVLNYAEVIIKGESEKEIFFSTYVCHPSMANNECSGPVL